MVLLILTAKVMRSLDKDDEEKLIYQGILAFEYKFFYLLPYVPPLRNV